MLTFHFYPPEVRQMIDALANQGSGLAMGTVTRPDGTQLGVSEAQITAVILDEFYQKTQVMIGEAIAGSVIAMLPEHAGELPAQIKLAEGSDQGTMCRSEALAGKWPHGTGYCVLTSSYPALTLAHRLRWAALIFANP